MSQRNAKYPTRQPPDLLASNYHNECLARPATGIGRSLQKGFIDVILSFLWRIFITVAHHLLLFIPDPLTHVPASVLNIPGWYISESLPGSGQTRECAISRNRGRVSGIWRTCRAPVTIDDGPDKMLTTWRWKCLIAEIIGSTGILKGDVNLHVPPDFQASLIQGSPLKVHSKSNLDLWGESPGWAGC